MRWRMCMGPQTACNMQRLHRYCNGKPKHQQPRDLVLRENPTLSPTPKAQHRTWIHGQTVVVLVLSLACTLSAHARTGLCILSHGCVFDPTLQKKKWSRSQTWKTKNSCNLNLGLIYLDEVTQKSANNNCFLQLKHINTCSTKVG